MSILPAPTTNVASDVTGSGSTLPVVIFPPVTRTNDFPVLNSTQAAQTFETCPAEESTSHSTETGTLLTPIDLGVTTINRGSPSTLDRPLPMLRHAPPSNLFPLLLAPIDRFFVDDDSKRFPMTSVIYMDFSGVIDRTAFVEAVDDAILRHPMLGAQVRRAKRGLPCWVPATDSEPAISWGTRNEPIQLAGEEGFQLDRELGIRFWVRSSNDSTRVVIQVHHACTDGTGVYRFLGDLWALYGMRTAIDDSAPSLGELDWRMLRHRRRRMADLANQGDQLWKYVTQGLREAVRVFGSRVQPLAAPHGRREVDAPLVSFPEIATCVLQKDEHEQLRAYAARQAATLNDLLLAEMFRTVARWNTQHQALNKHRAIRIMMPSDLRSTEDYSMPASNMTAYTFLAQKPDACHDSQRLLERVREATGRIKHDRLGTRFADAITLSEYAPAVLPFLLKRNWCMATTILSNVGDPSRRFTARFPRSDGKVVCGNLILEDVFGVPPLRANTHATLAIFTYLRRLTISVRCNPYLFTAADSRAFLELYESGLRSYLVNSG